MGNNLINISNPQNQLRQNKTLLLLVGGASSVAGLLIWSSFPFIFSNPKNKVNVCLRYLSLFGSLGCGVASVVAGKQLERINPLIRAVEQAERNDFLTALATSEYVQQQAWQREAMTALQPPVAVGNNFTDGGNVDRASVNEIKDSVTDAVTNDAIVATGDSAPTQIDPATEAYKPTYLAVVALLRQGASESKVIKDVLGQEGRNYQQGKQMLEALLQLGESQGW